MKDNTLILNYVMLTLLVCFAVAESAYAGCAHVKNDLTSFEQDLIESVFSAEDLRIEDIDLEAVSEGLELILEMASHDYTEPDSLFDYDDICGEWYE